MPQTLYYDSEDNINTMTNLALPPLSHVSPPSIPEDNKNNLTLPPPSYEQPSTCKDNKSKMFYKCSYCEYESPYKGNLKTHVKKKHEKNINESPNHISMKNETLKNNQNYLRKIKMMLKENVLLDLYIIYIIIFICICMCLHLIWRIIVTYIHCGWSNYIIASRFFIYITRIITIMYS